MTITAYNTPYPCARAEKSPTSIRIYDESGTCTAIFEGITDFDGYTIEGGDWSAPPPDPTQLLTAKVQAQTASLTFLEDCLVEMAGVIYA